MTAGKIRLRATDKVFRIGTKTYALEQIGERWQASDIIQEKGVYYFLDVPAELPARVVLGVVHQREWFLAARLDDFPMN